MKSQTLDSNLLQTDTTNTFWKRRTLFKYFVTSWNSIFTVRVLVGGETSSNSQQEKNTDQLWERRKLEKNPSTQTINRSHKGSCKNCGVDMIHECKTCCLFALFFCCFPFPLSTTQHSHPLFDIACFMLLNLFFLFFSSFRHILCDGEGKLKTVNPVENELARVRVCRTEERRENQIKVEWQITRQRIHISTWGWFNSTMHCVLASGHSVLGMGKNLENWQNCWNWKFAFWFRPQYLDALCFVRQRARLLALHYWTLLLPQHTTTASQLSLSSVPIIIISTEH